MEAALGPVHPDPVSFSTQPTTRHLQQPMRGDEAIRNLGCPHFPTLLNASRPINIDQTTIGLRYHTLS
jgi:hypothetical protein